MDERRLRPGQFTRVLIGSISGEGPVEVFRTDRTIFEAPNWTLDGRWLILNGDGKLWRLPSGAGGAPELIDLQGVPALNNDHVLAPDGEGVFVSANDWHIYEGSLTGGPVRRVTYDPIRMHFLHGVSPDGATLAYVGLDSGRANLFSIPVSDGPDRQLTNREEPFDGCEYSPDGEWLYCNTEAFSAGHAQIARLRPDGTGLEQLTFDERVNWFPHVSPDGRRVLYLSYPPGTRGHPADREIELRLIRAGDWSAPETLTATFGGQGTVNVNSWASDSTRFAYVDYPLS